jgi:hypothetical protein
MYSAESMYAAVFGRGVARLYAGWKMRFCTFSTLFNTTAATEAARRGLAEHSSAEMEMLEPTMVDEAEAEGGRRRLQADAFTMTISGQVGPLLCLGRRLGTGLIATRGKRNPNLFLLQGRCRLRTSGRSGLVARLKGF